jgi:hypothetical protein
MFEVVHEDFNPDVQHCQAPQLDGPARVESKVRLVVDEDEHQGSHHVEALDDVEKKNFAQPRGGVILEHETFEFGHIVQEEQPEDRFGFGVDGGV